MKTLQEHFDDLDRMIDTGASKPAIRDQVAFLWKQVASLQADYAGAVEHDAQTYAALATLQAEYEKIKSQDKRNLDDWFREQAQKQAEIRKRHTLNYDA